MSDKTLHLNRVHADGYSKYVYFLLAATGAALGYALQKLDGSEIDWTIWLGCKHIASIQSAIWTNFHLLQLSDGSHPNQPTSFEELAIARAAATQALENKNNAAQRFFNWQFRLLALGVLLFTAWRVLVLLGVAASAP